MKPGFGRALSDIGRSQARFVPLSYVSVYFTASGESTRQKTVELGRAIQNEIKIRFDGSSDLVRHTAEQIGENPRRIL